MAKFRKKPVVIEAFKWTGDEHQIESPEWAREAIRSGVFQFQNAGTPHVVLAIKTLEDGKQGQAKHVADRGDWIIKGIAGEFYPCKPDIFAATYEPVIDW